MPLIFQKRIYREDLKANPNITYVFGDNELRVGLGGQAGEMRGEPNAFGIPTKHNPGIFPSDYWSDADYNAHTVTLAQHFAELEAELSIRKTIVWPLDGIGTGLSDMPNRCPKIFLYLNNKLSDLKDRYSV